MPSASAHIAAAKIVKDKLNIKDDNFYIGALLPDILDMDKRVSHFKKQGSFFLVPKLDEYKNTHDLKDMTNLGYYLHLYIDYYFLEDYLFNNNPNIDVFNSNLIYKDYDILNKKVLDRFNVDKDEIIKILESIKDDKVSQRKLNNNIECLNKDKDGELILLKEKLFLDFIEKYSIQFVKELDKSV